MTRWRCGLVLLAMCVLVPGRLRAEPPGRAAPAGGGWEARAAEVVRLVREKFYDGPAAEAWATRHARYAAGVASDEQFAAATRQALAALKASHTGYYTPRDPEYYGLRAIFAPLLKVQDPAWDSPGADFTPDGFVRVAFAGGPAERAGLRRGDQVLEADGRPFHPVDSFRGRAGKLVSMKVRRAAGQAPEAVALTPRRIDPRQEWLEHLRQGAGLIEHGGKKVAYVPLFSCAGEMYQEALRELLAGRLREADALVLDFRNGWGGCNPDFVNLFHKAPPVLTSVGRDGVARTLDQQWRKPLVILVNEGSRSGKEAVSYAIQKHRLGTLVGQKTAGAVLGGTCLPLADGSLLFLAVTDIRVDGERLEGRGVRPDVAVEDGLPFAGGADPQRDRAVAVAAGQVR